MLASPFGAIMIEWAFFVLLLMAVLTVLWLGAADMFTWLFDKLGLSGKSDPIESQSSQALGLVRVPFDISPDKDHATGMVEYRGEIWSAQCNSADAKSLNMGTRCKILGSHGLVLMVGKENDQAV